MARERRDINQALRDEIERYIREDRQNSSDTTRWEPGEESDQQAHNEAARRRAEEAAQQRQVIEDLIGRNIWQNDGPIDDEALDALNTIRASQKRNEDTIQTGRAVQDKFVNIKEIHKMLQAICEYLRIQLIEVSTEAKTTKYQAIRKGTTVKEIKNIDRSKDLIFIDEEDSE